MRTICLTPMTQPDTNTVPEPRETIEKISPKESTDESGKERPEDIPTKDNRGSGRKGG